MTASIKDYLHLHFIVLIWGFTAILGLLITIPSVEIVFFRTLLAFVSLGILLYLSKENFKLEKRDITKILLTGVLVAAHWILFFAAARIATASVCLAGMATATLWTSFVDPLMNRKRVSGFNVFLGLVIIAGLYLIFRFEFNHALGLILSIISAFLAALFSVINGQFIRKHMPYMLAFYEMLGAWIGTLIFLPFYKKFFAINQALQLWPSIEDWVYLAILAIVCTVYPWGASIKLLRKISVFAMNLTINLEPVYGIMLALFFFGEKEKMTPGFYWGTLVILIAVFSYPLLKRAKKIRE